MSFTQWLQENRFTVVAVDAAQGRLRLRTHADTCRDVACEDETVIVGEDGQAASLGVLHPGDIVRVDTPPGQPQRIVLVRRVWDELTSPEF